MYLGIKEMSKIAQDVIIVTSRYSAYKQILKYCNGFSKYRACYREKKMEAIKKF
jgi:hypothetical protein